MAANALSRLVNNRSDILKLMELDMNGSMDKIVEGAVSDGSLSYGEEGATFISKGKKSGQQPAVVINEAVEKAHSRMPKAILESFKKNPGRPDEKSILDRIGVTNINESKNHPVQNTQSAQKPIQESGIDYSLLKTIINEAVQQNVKKYMSALSKKLISEGVGSGTELKAVKFGDKFSFITKDGDVYIAEMKYSGNINDKKHVNG